MINQSLSSLVLRNTSAFRPRNVFRLLAFKAARLPVLHSAGRGAPGYLHQQRTTIRHCHYYYHHHQHHHHCTRGQERSHPRPLSIFTATNTKPTPTIRLLNLNLNLTTSARSNRDDNKMATDEDYMAFLNKANQDPNEGIAATTTTKKTDKKERELKTTDVGAQIPAAILDATKDAFYVSDADEPFVPVCLAWEDEGGKKGLPDEGTFVCVLVMHLLITAMRSDIFFLTYRMRKSISPPTYLPSSIYR